MTNESLHVFNIKKLLNERLIDLDTNVPIWKLPTNVTIGRLNDSKAVINETKVSAIEWKGQV